MKYQVVLLDEKDFIIEYKDFTDLYEMADYIVMNSKRKDLYRIQITRWNNKGERV